MNRIFNFFKKKPTLIVKKKKPEKQKKSEPEIVMINSNDDCFVRAEKLFKSINLSGEKLNQYDWAGLSDHMAKGIKAYMDLDRRVFEEMQKDIAELKKCQK